ncbi:MAG: hypothetical protein HY332_10380, partial [Chloroflexi bacterium]|nr:hypothetical protein [Chloroflexota bacterium]
MSEPQDRVPQNGHDQRDRRDNAGGVLAGFRAAVAAGDIEEAGRVAATLPAGELRDALRALSSDQVEALFRTIGDERLAALLETLDPGDAADVLGRLPGAEAADVLEALAPDDAADVVGALEATSEDLAHAILVEMEPEEAGDVRAARSAVPARRRRCAGQEARRLAAPALLRRGLHRHRPAAVRRRSRNYRRARLLRSTAHR